MLRRHRSGLDHHQGRGDGLGSGDVLGRGITNSRSNYDTASRVAKLEALISTRLTLFRAGPGCDAVLKGQDRQVDGCWRTHLERNFRLELYLEQLGGPASRPAGNVAGICASMG